MRFLREMNAIRTSSWSMWMVNRDKRSIRSSLGIPSGIILGMAATQVLRRSSLGFAPLRVCVWGVIESLKTWNTYL